MTITIGDITTNVGSRHCENDPDLWARTSDLIDKEVEWYDEPERKSIIGWLGI